MKKKFTSKHASRLLTLAYFLKTKVADEAFDMCSILAHKDRFRYFQILPDPNKLFLNHTCGTTACALGYTPVVFPDRFKYEEDLSTPSLVFQAKKHGKKCYSDILSASTFFGMSRDEVLNMFYSGFHRDPKQVAKDLEEFVKERGYVYA